jgi:hypothetical protein
MQNHQANLLAKVEKILADGVLNSEACGFYADVFGFQSENFSAWQNAVQFPEFTNGLIRLNDESETMLIASLAALGGVVKKHYGGINFTSAINISRNELYSIIENITGKKTEAVRAFAEAAGCGFDEYLFLLINWLKPLFIAMRERAQISGDIEKNSCPFCGYYPDMALLYANEEGKRYLRCGLCEHIWPFKRIGCALCDGDDLKVFLHDNDERCRMDACKICNGYIKTVRMNKFEDMDDCDLTVENLASLSLDAEMLRNGYGKL